MTRTSLRRRAAVTGTVLLAGFVLSACGTTDDSGTSSTGAAATGAAATFSDADVTFAQNMIPHHQQAVAMAALADTRASDPEVKTLAAQIKAAQDPEITTMTGWLQAWGKPAPGASTGGMNMGGGADMGGSSMPGMMSADNMSKLAAASGKGFDKQFLLMMIEHHQGAITMAQDEVTGGKSPDATALASKIITAQQAEIVTMKAILARL